MSNNDRPLFTDCECIAIYLFGIAEGMVTVKSAYKFIRDFFPGWFPYLPRYQAFDYRICHLCDVIKELRGLLMSRRELGVGSAFLLDSLPVIGAKEKRSGHVRSAAELCAKSYCASQNIWYYGVKTHVLGQNMYQTLPNMMMVEVSPANGLIAFIFARLAVVVLYP
jgi:hypothetical protein